MSPVNPLFSSDPRRASLDPIFMNTNQYHAPAATAARRTAGPCGVLGSMSLRIALLLGLAALGRAEERLTGAATSSVATNAPALAEGVGVSTAVPHPGQDNRSNREAVQDAVARGDRAITVESSGGALRHLWRRPTWRGVFDLVDPRAPVPTVDVPAERLGDVRRAVGVPPAAFRDPYRDPASHEATARLF